MRVSDIYLQNLYMSNISKSKSELARIQDQLAKQSKVNKPSDSPLGSARIMRLTSQLENAATYEDNINNGIAFLDNSIISMDGIQSEIQKLLSDLATINNTLVTDYEVLASQIDMAINSMLDFANAEYDGEYLFSGTDHSGKPFNYDGSSVTIASSAIGGDHKVRIAKNIHQQINITGKELFVPVLQQFGNIDSTSGIGTPQSSTALVYDSEGNEYSFNFTYTMTAANTYDLSYEILDSGSNVVTSGSATNLVFNPATGDLESIDGSTDTDIRIQVPGNGIDFIFDIGSLNETTDPASLNTNLSQKTDIFNALIEIRDKLLAGEAPTEEQVNIVTDFNNHILSKISKAGTMYNRMSDASALLSNQKLELEDLISKEKDVDMARSLIDLQSYQLSLDLSYQLSSVILPKSLLDYL